MWPQIHNTDNKSILNKQPRYAIKFMASVGCLLLTVKLFSNGYNVFQPSLSAHGTQAYWIVLEAAMKLFKLLTLLFKTVHVGSSYHET